VLNDGAREVTFSSSVGHRRMVCVAAKNDSGTATRVNGPRNKLWDANITNRECAGQAKPVPA